MTADRSNLRKRYENGIVLEDFIRLSDSLESRISRAYWEKRGLQTFLGREVPSEITNDGIRASQAAEVLFANCLEAHCNDTLPDTIIVVEIGVGIGLFSRLLLRRFKILCEQEQHNFHDRLVYYVTDISERNVADIRRLGTLEEFGEHVRLGKLDANEPSEFQPCDLGELENLSGKVQALFHNYLYDTLPQSQLLKQGESWYELHVQTRLHEPWQLDNFENRDIVEFLTSVRTGCSKAITELLSVYQFIAAERSFFPVDVASLPYSDVVSQFCEERIQPLMDDELIGSNNIRLWVPWGAIGSCVNSMVLLRESGFMLFCDYGVTDLRELTQANDYQRYGAGLCVGLNFPFLDFYLTHTTDFAATLTVPDGDEALPLHSRLLTTNSSSRTRDTFKYAYSAERLMEFNEPVTRARNHLDGGDFKAAFGCYADAIGMCDQNWPVLGEWAHAANSIGDPVSSVLETVGRALEINPSCSADLWNECGDALLRGRHFADAEQAYRTAIAINPEHSRSYFNLARTYSEQEEFDGALHAIANSLSFDRSGRHTDLLLQKQAELLACKRDLLDKTHLWASSRQR